MKARILTHDGLRTVPCIWRACGLAVTRAYRERGWTVTATSTGRSVAWSLTGIRSRRAAMEIASMLTSAVDWRGLRHPLPREHDFVLGEFVRVVLEMFGVHTP